MAIKKIVPYGNELLRKKSKEVLKISKKIQILVHDMIDTMYANNGVGLAAPQVGENLRIFVIDVSTGKEPLNPRVFITDSKSRDLLWTVPGSTDTKIRACRRIS